MFPQKVENLEAFSPDNQAELWKSILEDRKNPSRTGIWPGIQDFPSLQNYMNSCNLSDSEEHGYVIRGLDRKIVGTFHLFNIVQKEKQIELGFGLHLAYEGKGFATKALQAVEGFLSKQGFRNLIIACDQWNERSWNIPERNGYSLKRIFHKDRECPGCDDCIREYEKAL